MAGIYKFSLFGVIVKMANKGISKFPLFDSFMFFVEPANKKLPNFLTCKLKRCPVSGLKLPYLESPYIESPLYFVDSTVDWSVYTRYVEVRAL